MPPKRNARKQDLDFQDNEAPKESKKGQTKENPKRGTHKIPSSEDNYEQRVEPPLKDKTKKGKKNKKRGDSDSEEQETQFNSKCLIEDAKNSALSKKADVEKRVKVAPHKGKKKKGDIQPQSDSEHEKLSSDVGNNIPSEKPSDDMMGDVCVNEDNVQIPESGVDDEFYTKKRKAGRAKNRKADPQISKPEQTIVQNAKKNKTVKKGKRNKDGFNDSDDSNSQFPDLTGKLQSLTIENNDEQDDDFEEISLSSKSRFGVFSQLVPTNVDRAQVKSMNVDVPPKTTKISSQNDTEVCTNILANTHQPLVSKDSDIQSAEILTSDHSSVMDNATKELDLVPNETPNELVDTFDESKKESIIDKHDVNGVLVEPGELEPASVKLKISKKELKKIKKKEEFERLIEDSKAKIISASGTLDNFALSQAGAGMAKVSAFDNQVDIKVEGFSIAAKGKDLFVNANLSIVRGRRYGLVGPNGLD
ncbi:unnamed protein product [Protopolystoma xenopodis]|uniref:ABC transporter domain-containing protein n=1 Tax=Protopolystoma xenopodis TaxID=117903 RepID=A0A448WG04_9PLAT|nr:unnamed protein product [Protopolystoma xenopodis]